METLQFFPIVGNAYETPHWSRKPQSVLNKCSGGIFQLMIFTGSQKQIIKVALELEHITRLKSPWRTWACTHIVHTATRGETPVYGPASQSISNHSPCRSPPHPLWEKCLRWTEVMGPPISRKWTQRNSTEREGRQMKRQREHTKEGLKISQAPTCFSLALWPPTSPDHTPRFNCKVKRFVLGTGCSGFPTAQIREEKRHQLFFSQKGYMQTGKSPVTPK